MPYADLVMPVLLAEARRAYTLNIRSRLTEAGFDDMPRAGVRVIGRIAAGGTTVTEVGGAYGVSKQAASKLVDALVMRGYVERVGDPEDRRRLIVALTERGRAASEVVRAAIAEIDERLTQDLGDEWLSQLRGGLAVLVGYVHDEQ